MISYSTMTKLKRLPSPKRAQKTAYKTLKQFIFNLRIVFELYVVKHPFKASAHFYCAILV